MARMHTVKKSQKPQTCRVCGKEIPEGSPYKWTKPRYRGKIAAHINCQITESMVSSSKMAAVHDQQAASQTSIDNATTLEEITEALNDLAQTARDTAEEYRQSAENKKEFFPDDEAAQEWEEWAEGLEDWAQEIESAANEVEGIAVEETDAEQELDREEDETDEEWQDRVREKQEEMDGESLDAALEEAKGHTSVIDECPY